jgi:uncharacterized DUF497 family protein
MELEFSWNEAKRESNLEKHRIDFEDAIAIFEEAVVVQRSDRGDEQRWVAVGQTEGHVLAVVYTLREGLYHIISARSASRNERRAYHKAAPGG